MEKYLKALKKLLVILDEKSSHEDLILALHIALEILSKIEEETGKNLEEIRNTFQKLSSAVKDDPRFGELKAELEAAIKRIKPIIGLPGKKGDKGDSYILTEKDKTEIAGKIKVPVVEKIVLKTETVKEPIVTQEIKQEIKEVAIYETAQQIRDKLESLKEDERLDRSAVKGLEAALQELRGLIAAVPRGRVGGARKIQYTRSINLTSQVDGSTSTFTLPRDTVRVLGVFGTQFPMNFNENVDWTFAGVTLTLVTSQVGVPQSGQTLWALVETLFYA